VAHTLVAGGFITGFDSCGSLDSYSAYKYGAYSYNLNVVEADDPNCGGGKCLLDLLLAMGWTKTTSTSAAGTVCAVNGGDGPYTHVVYAVGGGLCDAHNAAHLRVPCTTWAINLCVKPPGTTSTDEGASDIDAAAVETIAVIEKPAQEQKDKEGHKKHKKGKGFRAGSHKKE
jgi:hypothetical protein